MRFKPLDDRGALVGGVVVADHVADQVNIELVGDLGVDLGQEFLNSIPRCLRWIEEITVPSAVLNAATPPLGASRRGDHQAGRAMAHIVVGAFLTAAWHHRKRRLRAGQGLHLGLFVHAIDHGRLRRVQIQSDDVVYLFSTNCGSVESLNPSWRCGFSSNARQIRPIVDLDRPLRSAIFARDQCVAFFGIDSSVATTTSSTCSVVIVGGRPGRGSSTDRPGEAQGSGHATC